jgi:predicted esterase
MKLKITFLLLLFKFSAFAQTPEKQGLVEYTIPYKNDSIHFYIYNPKKIQKQKIFLYLQGTGAYPMVNADSNGECCNNNFPKKLMMQFPAQYAFVYIRKIGLPYYVNNPNFKIDQNFTDNNYVSDRAIIADKVINHLLKKIYPKAKIVAVLGHSEGTHVLSKLVAINKKITHICYAAGSGYSFLNDQILLVRNKMINQEINPSQADTLIQNLYNGVDSILNAPFSTNKYFMDETHRWWYDEIIQPPIENLVKLKIPIYLVAGSNDKNVPIQGSDYIKSEFIRLKKTNLTYKVYQNSDHSFKETLPNGEIKNHWDEIFFDFIKFIETRK